MISCVKITFVLFQMSDQFRQLDKTAAVENR